jgi:hypothetical protein
MKEVNTMNDSEKAKVCLSRIVDLFKEGNIPKALAVATIPPQRDIPSAKWSISNRVLQFLADTSDGRGFRQWENAGRKVKKGVKAFHILGPKARTIKETDDDGTETRKVIVAGFFAIPIFRAEDTDGEPLPYEPATPPPLADVAEQFGLSVSYQTFASRYYGTKPTLLITPSSKGIFPSISKSKLKPLPFIIRSGLSSSQVGHNTASILSIYW